MTILAVKFNQLTYPSGWSLMRNFFRLNESFRILAHENVLIREMPWNTEIPMCATAKFNGTFSWSLPGCIFIPKSSQRLAVSRRFKSASAGACPLKKMFYFISISIIVFNAKFETYTCFLWFSIIFLCIKWSCCGTNLWDDK